MSRDGRLEHRIEEYWGWVAVALFLLLSVDLLTTLYAAAAVGVVAESNPLMRWLLGEPLAVLVGAHLLVTGLAVAFFYALMEMLRRSPPRFRRGFALAVEVWLGLLVAVGLAVFANNLTVIVLGRSLF